MKRLTRWSLALGALLALCGVAPGAAMADGPKTEVIRLQDACDLDSFNANPLTAGGCVRDAGGVSAEEFLAKINPKDFGHRAWWFNASGGRVGTTTIRAGDTLRAVNEGGEIHSFTEVAQFGGGCLPQFTEPLGLPTRDFASECLPAFGTIVFPGASRDETGLSVGTHRFQCVIHPWMRQTVEVRPA
jgi:plastocyanin